MLKFWKDTSGATAIEYGLIAAFMGAGLITAVSSMGGETSNNFSSIETVLTDNTIDHLRDVALAEMAEVPGLATQAERTAAYRDALSQADSAEALIATAEAVVELSGSADVDVLIRSGGWGGAAPTEFAEEIGALARAQYEASPTGTSAIFYGYSLLYEGWGTPDYVQAIEHWSNRTYFTSINSQSHLYDAYIGAGLMDTPEGRAALEHGISIGSTRAQEILDGLDNP